MRTIDLTQKCGFRRILIVWLLIAACDGENKDGNSDGEAPEAAGGAITLWTDSTELFMEHPALIVGKPDKFAVHLTDITDYAPLRSGRITLRFVPRSGGAPLVVRQDTPRAPGIYGPSPAFTAAGLYDLHMLVDSPQAKDSILVPNLRVYATETEAPRETDEPARGISFLKEQQWKIPGFRTDFAMIGEIGGSIEAAGAIIPAAGRHAQVSAPTSGVVDAGSIASSPSPGARVRHGQALAQLVPSLDAAGSAYADARARYREAQDEHARAKRLVEAEAAPQRRLHEAANRLQAAREALASVGGAGAGGRIVVRSPISGIVAERAIVPGSRVEAGATLFTIVDPSVVWLSVNVPAQQAGRVNATSRATFQLDGDDRRIITSRVVNVGAVIDSQSRTLPVTYEVINPGNIAKIGATARVQLATGQRMQGVLIPASSILDEDGRPIAFVQIEGELFEKRELVLGARDGSRALVVSGIQARDRVVTGAAYQVRLASLSTNVPAEGHAH